MTLYFLICILCHSCNDDSACYFLVPLLLASFFDYSYLRKAFLTALLNELESKIGPSFKKTKAAIYRKDINGFYVYAKPNLCDPQTVVNYISRYLGRPVIALKRINSYDGENVTFHYNRYEDNAFLISG